MFLIASNIMSLKRLLSLKSCSYIEEKTSRVCLAPLGETVKENIIAQLVKSYMRLPQVQVFRAPSSSASHEAIPHQDISLHQNLLSLYVNQYKNWVTTSSFGIIQLATCIRESDTESLMSHDHFDCLTFTLFCPINESLNLFQRFQGKRHQWWKNYSRTPLQSKFVPETRDINKPFWQQWLMHYSLPTALSTHQIQLESIKYFSEQKSLKKKGINDMHVIACDIDLDHATLAYLDDSFSQSDKNNKVMHFNSSLAPFKVALYFTCEETSRVDLTSLSEFLIQALKECDITVFPVITRLMEASFNFKNFDELGIPYAIKLDQNTLDNGVVTLRNRDTTIEEEIHVSHLVRVICAYLKS